MIYPEADKLEDWGSKFALVALAAKRAKQIKAGAPILVDTQSRNPLTIALEEIAAGRIICKVSDQDIPIPSAVAPEVAELLAIPIEPEPEVEGAGVEEHGEEKAASLGEEEEELLEEEEEEEEEHPLGADDVWKEVLDEDTEDEAHSEPSSVIGPDAVETSELAEKPKRGRRRAAADAGVPIDLPEETPDVEGREDQQEEE